MRVPYEAFQGEVVGISNLDRNLPPTSLLIMLFLLGFLVILLYAVEDAEVETYDRYTDFRASNTSP